MGINYPAGPEIDRIAHLGNSNTYHFTAPLNDDSYNFSFSGLKSSVINLVHKEQDVHKEDLLASFQETVIESLTRKTIKAMNDYDVKNFLLAGGVSANRGIRDKFKSICEAKGISYTFPDIKYCTDNAAMIAAAGYFSYKEGIKADFTLNANPGLEIE